MTPVRNEHPGAQRDVTVEPLYVFIIHSNTARADVVSDRCGAVRPVNAVFVAVGSLDAETDPTGTQRVFSGAARNVFRQVPGVFHFRDDAKDSFRRQIVRLAGGYGKSVDRGVVEDDRQLVVAFVDVQIDPFFPCLNPLRRISHFSVCCRNGKESDKSGAENDCDTWINCCGPFAHEHHPFYCFLPLYAYPLPFLRFFHILLTRKC